MKALGTERENHFQTKADNTGANSATKLYRVIAHIQILALLMQYEYIYIGLLPLAHSLYSTEYK